MKYLFFLFFISVFFSCVPPKQYEELQLQHTDLKSKMINQKKVNQKLILENTELLSEIEKLSARMFQLKKDTTEISKALKLKKKSFQDLNENYQLLLNKSNKMLAENAEENRKLLEKLELLKYELQMKEDSLALENERLSDLNIQLDLSKKEIDLREGRVNELEAIINKKDSVMFALKNKVKKALLGFEGKGLSVDERNGKVYVSLDNSLLFASGSWDIDKKGRDAIEKLGTVLAEQDDINVLIEGHTDNVPYNGVGLVKNNWDLSVIRATAIVDILMENKKIVPKRLTAAGRGEYSPIASNKNSEDKAKNRRIEIILTPDLGELVDFLNEVK